MTDEERTIVRTMYDLTVELFEHQGDEIAALRKSNGTASIGPAIAARSASNIGNDDGSRPIQRRR